MRQYTYDIHPLIRERWSPRAFDPDYRVNEEQMRTLVEAANLAPSAFNGQPRRFLLAYTPEDFETVFSTLDEGNQVWCRQASAFIVVLVQTLRDNGKPNRWAAFDTGTAFGLLTLQAVSMGLHTHAMAGFDRVRIRELFQIEEALDPITVVAVGRYGDRQSLPEHLQEREFPQGRKPIDDMIYK